MSVNIMENDLCHACGVVATPEHFVFNCKEMSTWEEKTQFLQDKDIFDLRNPEYLAILQELANKIFNYHHLKFINRGGYN